MRKLYIFIMLGFLAGKSFGQMPNDAIYMNKKAICAALIYDNTQWNKYWEGTLKRENPNIGIFTNQTARLMAVYGVTKKLNITANIPYVVTNTSAGNLMGLKGFQDISAWAKYNFFSHNFLSFHGILGASLPLTNYVAEFQPMSIGNKSKTLTMRLLANYKTSKGFYLNAIASNILRDNITIDKDAYQAFDKVYNTNKVFVPNVFETVFKVGILKKKYQVETFIEHFQCFSGDNIRYNDMPFPTNKSMATSVGIYAKYQPKYIGFNARASHVIDGANTGQGTSFSAGFLYQIENFKLQIK